MGPGEQTADLHGRTCYQAKITIDALLRRAPPGTYRLRLIHGCHGGAELRTMIWETYARHPRVKRLILSPDGGATALVLREYQEGNECGLR